jgi:2-polyprenyl-6-methoxyphenol hydroxylase-like FAD-dependent oxidoreductase
MLFFAVGVTPYETIVPKCRSMRQADIVIAGAGLAGSTAAAMLSRTGYDVVLVDPHPVYPPDFRCEKLDQSQIEILRKTGLADAVLRVATPNRSLWVARFGHLVEKLKGAQCGIVYDTLVNTVRGEVPAAAFVAGKVASIETSEQRQVATLASGEKISARLMVLANGLNIGLRHQLGIERKIISETHSISIGFDLKPSGAAPFEFSALTYYPERSNSKMAYLTLFPIGERTRANLFVYRDMRDPWLSEFRHAPKQTLLSMIPRLETLTGPFDIEGLVKIRPIDLYVSEGYRQPGVVLVGDAFATSCPAAGTGAGKALMDVERLCNVHIPQWLTTPGMGADKIAAFYDDPVKSAYDAWCDRKAFGLKLFSLGTGPYWTMQRWAKFTLQWLKGAVHRTPQDAAVEAPSLVPAQAAGGEQPQLEPTQARQTV